MCLLCEEEGGKGAVPSAPERSKRRLECDLGRRIRGDWVRLCHMTCHMTSPPLTTPLDGSAPYKQCPQNSILSLAQSTHQALDFFFSFPKQDIWSMFRSIESAGGVYSSLNRATPPPPSYNVKIPSSSWWVHNTLLPLFRTATTACWEPSAQARCANVIPPACPKQRSMAT